MWANNYEKCIICGKDEFPHASKGLCRRCYGKYQHRKDNPHKYLPLENKTFQLTKEYLFNEYVINKKSLGDIAKEYKCTRQFIFKKLIEFGLKRRSRSDARLLAYEKKKVSYSRIDRDGNIKEISPIKAEVDDYFFSYWSAPMAWVLGFIYADGSLDAGVREKPKQTREVRVTMAQKEPEILEKIKVFMRSNQKLTFSKQRIYGNTVAGERYELVIRSKQIFNDLIKIGLTPNKSLTITFPEVPHEYIWHFIRGLWDGDGCLFTDKSTGKLFGSFVSGSRPFIMKLLEILEREIGIGKSVAHQRGNSSQFRLSTINTLKLCHQLYDGVSPDMYLSRKYKVYLNYLEKSMSEEKLRVRKGKMEL